MGKSQPKWFSASPNIQQEAKASTTSKAIPNNSQPNIIQLFVDVVVINIKF